MLKWYGAPVNQYIHETGTLIAEYREKIPGILIENAYFKDYMVAFPPYAHFAPSTMVIHKSVFDTSGMFDTSKSNGEDLDLFFRIGLHFSEVGYCHTVAANKYERNTSITYTKQRDIRRTLAIYRKREELAESLGEDVRRRAEPRIMYWVTRRLKSSLSRGDTSAVREIYAGYKHRLSPRWRWAARLYLALPWAVRPAFAVRNILSAKKRAFRATGIR